MKYLLLAMLLTITNIAAADGFDAVEAKLKAAMASDIRTDAEKARDRNRKPVETLKFFGLRDDMTLIELIPGGGWYTKLLAPVMKDNGQYYAALGTSTIAQTLMDKPGFEKAKIIATDSTMHRDPGSRHYSLETNGLGVTGADMVLTFRNYHNFDAAGRAALNEAVFAALRHGGIYGVVDHTRRHMEADNPENRRRVDPVMAIKEIQAAGFRLVDYSTLHFRPDDELRYEVGRHTVTGNTDRFTLKFIKP